MNSQSEFSDLKRSREDLPSSPEQNTTPTNKKKKRKKKNKGSPNPRELSANHPQEKGAEPDEASVEPEQPQVRPKVVLVDVDTAIPIQSEQKSTKEIGIDTEIEKKKQNEITVEHSLPVIIDSGKVKGVGEVGPNEATAEKPDPIPSEKKKEWEKKKSSVVNHQGAEVELKEPNCENSPLCSMVDPAIPVGLEPNIVKEKGAEVEPNEANKHESGIPVVLEKKEGAELNGTGPKNEPAILVELEKKNGAGPNEGTSEHPQVLPVSDPTPSKDTPRKRKWKRKKKNELKPQGAELKEPNHVEHPQLCSPVHPELKKEKEMGADPNEANAEHPQVCTKPVQAPQLDIASPIDPEKKKGAVPTEANAENLQVCPKPESALPVGPAIPTTPTDQSRRKQKKRRGRKRKMCSEEKMENQSNPLQTTHNQTQPDPSVSICPEPASPIDQTIPVDAVLSVCATPVIPLIGQAIPVSPAIPMDIEQKTMKKKRKKKRKSTLNGAEPNKHNTEPPETPIQISTCPIPATPISLTISTDPEQKITKKKRKRKSALKSEGEEPNEHIGKPPETLVQRSMCPIAAPPIDPTIPIDQPIPVDPATLIHPATPIDPELKMTKKKRKKKRNSVLKSEGTEPDEHNADPSVETSVQPTKGLTVTVIPLKWPNESSMRKHNAKPLAKTRIQRTEGLTVTEVPFKWHGKSSMRCRSCQQSGHRSRDCPRLQFVSLDDEINIVSVDEIAQRCQVCQQLGHRFRDCPSLQFVSLDDEMDIDSLEEIANRCRSCQQPGHRSRDCPSLQVVSLDDEICFFCGEFGHSLGKCSVSKAGGGKFANCLFCYAQGHFSKYCPQKRYGIYSKHENLKESPLLRLQNEQG